MIEDNSVRSDSTTKLNGRIGYKISPTLSLQLEGFNLTDSDDSAIDYLYASRLQGECAEGFDDIHFHPMERRSFRVTSVARF